MNPPYTLTAEILELLTAISELLGEIRVGQMDVPAPELRKQNQIRTIHHSLKIEGNSLSEAQITALLEGKRIMGPQKDIAEVLNAISVYEQLDTFVFFKEASFLKAHELLMQELISPFGVYRTQGVGIVRGDEVQHYAPPADRVPYLMKELFKYLRHSRDLPLVKGCVFHYELEFIHPFLDGNGRMGRLWQTVILTQANPVFRYLPLETVISRRQAEYYEVLARCDKAGNSTAFIQFMLEVIQSALQERAASRITAPRTQTERLQYFMVLGNTTFTRADYLHVFRSISTATASRDLAAGVQQGLFTKSGEKNKTVYSVG